MENKAYSLFKLQKERQQTKDIDHEEILQFNKTAKLN